MNASTVSSDSRKASFLRPAPVAVHDDGYMPRNSLTVDLLKQLFFDGSLLEMPFEIGFDFPIEDGHGRRAAGQ
jgi:hypothetical protein